MSITAAPLGPATAAAGGEVLLRGIALTRRWGGLVAVNAVSLALQDLGIAIASIPIHKVGT